MMVCVVWSGRGVCLVVVLVGWYDGVVSRVPRSSRRPVGADETPEIPGGGPGQRHGEGERHTQDLFPTKKNHMHTHSHKH